MIPPFASIPSWIPSTTASWTISACWRMRSTIPRTAGQQQHILRVDYNKDRGFGKLNIHVRAVAQITPEQLKTYTPRQIFDFGEADTAKFTKTDPGSFGRPGDVYFEPSADGGAMGTSPVTPEVQAQYEHYVTQYLLPALEKKAADGNSP